MRQGESPQCCILEKEFEWVRMVSFERQYGLDLNPHLATYETFLVKVFT